MTDKEKLANYKRFFEKEMEAGAMNDLQKINFLLHEVALGRLFSEGHSKFCITKKETK